MKEDIEEMVEKLENYAEENFVGEYTTKILKWEDGDFRICVFHTLEIDIMKPIYRERVVYSTTNNSSEDILYELSKRDSRPIYRERL